MAGFQGRNDPAPGAAPAAIFPDCRCGGKVTPDDAEQAQAIYAPYCYTPISFETEPPSVEEMRGRLAKVLGQYPWLTCEDGGEVLGYAYATQQRERAAYRWSVDTSVYVRQGRQRRGVGRALYTSPSPRTAPVPASRTFG